MVASAGSQGPKKSDLSYQDLRQSKNTSVVSLSKKFEINDQTSSMGRLNKNIEKNYIGQNWHPVLHSVKSPVMFKGSSDMSTSAQSPR